ncbi:hypothetical protein RRG08_020107 [Elysia crispata]|uniref:Uncharacterized protein n=1 Tax=Elysia crispata TaxID=231223 RepID=A0AAE1A6M1_9GAST|nr:hypothetical protein RRG08_020107 [Elysia crispata]
MTSPRPGAIPGLHSWPQIFEFLACSALLATEQGWFTTTAASPLPDHVTRVSRIARTHFAPQCGSRADYTTEPIIHPTKCDSVATRANNQRYREMAGACVMEDKDKTGLKLGCLVPGGGAKS